MKTLLKLTLFLSLIAPALAQSAPFPPLNTSPHYVSLDVPLLTDRAGQGVYEMPWSLAGELGVFDKYGYLPVSMWDRFYRNFFTINKITLDGQLGTLRVNFDVSDDSGAAIKPYPRRDAWVCYYRVHVARYPHTFTLRCIEHKINHKP